MNFTDVLYLGLFIVVWIFLVTKVFPKFGINS